jgi:iron(III) transport system ATP-binding protein
MNILEVQSLYKSFDRGRTYVLKDIHLSVEEGKIYALIGDSGSGKTTLFRLIAGLEPLNTGTIRIKNKRMSDETRLVPPHERGIGMVFQDLALFPHLTVSRNISFGLADHDDDKVKEMLTLIELEGYENRYPDQLSIGQQQRVAIARALATNPEILLLDEPFSNLDETLKQALRGKLLTIANRFDTTMFLITHDVRDALAIAEKGIFLQDGEVIEQGPMDTIFNNPQSGYVQAVKQNLTRSAEHILSKLGG